MGKIPCTNEELRPGLRIDEMKVLESVELTGDGDTVLFCQFSLVRYSAT